MEAESAAQDALDDEVVGAVSGANAHAEVDLPVGGDVEIDGREKLLLLVVQSIDAVDRTQGSVVFHAQRDFSIYVE